MRNLVQLLGNFMANLTSVRAVWRALSRAAQKSIAGIFWVGTRVLGRLNWQPPAWLGWSGRRLAQAGRYVTADAKRAAIALIVLMSMAGGWVWYKTRPVPHYVTYTVTAPGLTEYGDKGISSIKPLEVEFSESVAPLRGLPRVGLAG